MNQTPAQKQRLLDLIEKSAARRAAREATPAPKPATTTALVDTKPATCRKGLCSTWTHPSTREVRVYIETGRPGLKAFAAWNDNSRMVFITVTGSVVSRQQVAFAENDAQLALEKTIGFSITNTTMEAIIAALSAR